MSSTFESPAGKAVRKRTPAVEAAPDKNPKPLVDGSTGKQVPHYFVVYREDEHRVIAVLIPAGLNPKQIQIAMAHVVGVNPVESHILATTWGLSMVMGEAEWLAHIEMFPNPPKPRCVRLVFL